MTAKPAIASTETREGSFNAVINNVSSKLGPYHSGQYHNPVAAPGASRRSTTSCLAEIRLKGALPQPTTLYSVERDVSEDHGVPGSSPGPATSGLFQETRL